MCYSRKALYCFEKHLLRSRHRLITHYSLFLEQRAGATTDLRWVTVLAYEEGMQHRT
jgi:hypothetical protein